jgi:hypothetical protein
MEEGDDWVEVKFSDGEVLKFPPDCVAYKDKAPFCKCARCISFIVAAQKHNVSNSVHNL